MPDLLIPKEDFSQWLSDQPHILHPLLQGYREAISNMTSDLLSDPRSSTNTHVLNFGFEKQQRYFMGFQPIPENSKFILSCLYVYPDFRRKGYGKHLIDTAKQIVQDKALIQVAVEKRKLSQLDRFYKDQGFQSTDDIIPDGQGMEYRDYFWSTRKLSLSRVGNVIAVWPQ